LEKRVNVRVEHIKHSKCRQEFLDRVVANDQKKKEAKEAGGKLSFSIFSLVGIRLLNFVILLVSFNLKRIPAQPREARHISTKFNVPQTIAPIAYETLL
jgi:large subunit ribosomal protein L21e